MTRSDEPGMPARSHNDRRASSRARRVCYPFRSLRTLAAHAPMIPPHRPRLHPARRAAVALAFSMALLPGLSAAARAQSADSTAGSVPDSTKATLRPDPALAESLHAEHLENVSAFRAADSTVVVTYENRYWRHGATALGRVAAVSKDPRLAYERRL